MHSALWPSQEGLGPAASRGGVRGPQVAYVRVRGDASPDLASLIAERRGRATLGNAASGHCHGLINLVWLLLWALRVCARVQARREGPASRKGPVGRAEGRPERRGKAKLVVRVRMGKADVATLPCVHRQAHLLPSNFR